MKLQPADSLSIRTSGIQKTVQFGIKSSGLAHIFHVLRNQLYSDKIKAVIREYACNAVDAQVENGNATRPIEVTIPNRLNLVFKVRDFGAGLTEADIQDVYAFYGESTKRNSNELTGMLGIGSKSAFSYGDNFVIHSFLNGRKHIYNAFIDPSQIGQITKLGEEFTDEENGIEICVPVMISDVEEFRSKAFNLFRWFKVCPIIKGAAQFSYDDQELLFKGDDWQFGSSKGKNNSYCYHEVGSSYEPVAIMGNIAYPISFNSLKADSTNKGLQSLMSSNLILRFNIGELEIAASREQLQYSDYTRQKIVAKLEKVQKQIADKISESFEDCQTLFDAKKLFGAVFDYGSDLYQLREVLANKLKWKGKTVGDSQFMCSIGADWHAVKGFKVVKSRKNNLKYRYEDATRINCEKNTVVFLNDLDTDRTLLGRVLASVIEEGKSVYFLKFKDAQALTAWLKESEFDGEMKKLSTMTVRKLSEFYPKTPNINGTTSIKDVKHTTKEFTVKWSEIEDGSSWDNHKGKYFETSEVDVNSDSGVYILIDRFNIHENEDAVELKNPIHPTQLKNIRNQMKTLGIDLPSPLHAFKVKMSSKVAGNSNWVSFNEWAKAKILERFAAENLLQKFVDRTAAMSMDGNVLALYKKLIKTLKLKKNIVMDNSLLLTFLNKMKEMLNDNDNNVLDTAAELFNSFKLDKGLLPSQPSFDIDALNKEVWSVYGMLKYINHWEESDSKNTLNDIVNYINVIDISKSSSKT